MTRTWFVSTLLAMALVPALAIAYPQAPTSGQVQIPLDVYQQLLANSQQGEVPRAPVNHALGSARVNVQVASTEPRASAEVSVTLSIRILEDRWALVPVVPTGTPVIQVLVDGGAAQLVPTPQGLSWATQKSGTYSMVLRYRLDAGATTDGYVLAVPVPEAASTDLTATLPGSGLDVAVIPGAGIRSQASGNNTVVTGAIPTTRGLQISWRTPSKLPVAFSRAVYRGELQGSAVSWRSDLTVELFSDETATLELFPKSVTLTNLQVDGKEAPILVEGQKFRTLVRGRGVHRIIASFQTAVVASDGPPRVELSVPQVPVSRFELTLPGQKELTAEPGTNVVNRTRGGTTTSTVHVPLTRTVTLSWSEAVPETVRQELRANASLYHVVHAEEGVLYGRARLAYDVRRGETNRLELLVPSDIQVNQVLSPSGAVADWRVAREGDTSVLEVFLDRQVQGELLLDVHYDRSLGGGDAESLPLLEARGVGRQRGMVALLSSRDLTLDPVDEAGATRVGENQLPAFVRDDIELVVAHTFKYADAPPAMSVSASEPERVAGRFDAEVDSLLSLGDVTLTTSASVSVHVKSGGLDALELVLPADANLLNLSAPSLRSNRPSDDDPRVLELEFTQEMEGHFRIELSYERILAEDETEVGASTLRVRGADVEQGRVAVEASSAVEVRPARTDELSPIDVAELPRQLLLQTTHPILLAFKYVRAEPEPTLALQVTRHRVVDVQEAAIDTADYKTLFTRDGLSVTTARYLVRNARKQFLRIDLPEDSEVWAVFVDGRPEKPALAEGEDDVRSILVKIVNRSEGFPVELTYATKTPAIGRLGTVRARLPRPDILVTESRWDLFLPEGLDYGAPSTNLDVVRRDAAVSEAEMKEALAGLADRAATTQVVAPLHITVPATGVRYSFRKLYANQGDVEARAAVPYATATGTALGQLVVALGAALVWLGGVLLFTGDERLPRRAQLALTGAGTVVLLVALGVYHAGAGPAVLVSILAGGVLAAPRARRLVERIRAGKTVELEG